LFLFVGPHDTAKSTVASLLEEFLGDGNYAGLSLDSMMDDRFEKYKLYRMHANISGELANRFIKDTSLLKELMGWDIISVRLMHSQIKFMFRNFAKLIFLANQIPATYETDDAFYPKVQIFEFTKQFKEGEEGTRRKDELMAELTTEGEMSGLLNKAVKALQELLKRGKFKTSKSEQENKELYLIKANPLKYYIENSLTIANEIGEVNDPDGNKIKITKQDVYGNFLGFCKHYRLPALSQTAFFKNLNDYLLKRGIPINRRDTTGKGYYPWLELAVLYTDTKNSDSNSYDDLL
jgi:putative DNA primase/helicase